MLNAASGENSARVVALQILLNRDRVTSPKLTTDGVFGKLTESAINVFRDKVMRQSGPKGVADPALWRFLVDRAHLQVVDAVDVTDPMLLEQTVPQIEKWTDPIVIGGMSNGVEQLVREVRARVRGERSLMMLRLHGHGSPGLIALSHGSRRVTPGVDPFLAQSIIANQIIPVLTPLLQQLAPLMHNFGFVELHACHVAEGAAGALFVRKLADILRAPVRAGLAIQPATGVFDLVGKTVTGIPGNISLRDWGQSREEGVRQFAGPPPPPRPDRPGLMIQNP